MIQSATGQFQLPSDRQHSVVDAHEIQQRCSAIGRELFERAHAAEPRIWNRAWWDGQMLDYFSDHPRLQTQLFRFVETLPYARDDADLADHLKQYLTHPGLDLPLPFRMAIGFDRPDSWWGRIVGASIRKGALLMARTFMTGTNTREAIAHAQSLRKKGMTFTLDVLGEATIGDRQADDAAGVYLELIEALGRASQTWLHIPLLDESLLDGSSTGTMPRANVSVKLTSLDPVFDPIDPQRAYDVVRSRLKPLLLRARELGVFVNVDMESFRYRDMTFWIFKKLLSEDGLADFADVGIVVQAYLTDAEDDLRDLLAWVDKRGTPIGVRLVKGAYWDSETTNALRHGAPIPVWTNKWQSDACYEKLTGIMLDSAHLIRPAFASHNVRSLAHAMAYAESAGVSTRGYELQMLAGMGDPLKLAITQMGRCLRVYCPYGELVKGMAYLIRRLLENTSNDSFLKHNFGDRSAYDTLLAPPNKTKMPSAPLPQRRDQDPFEDDPMFVSSGRIKFTNAVPTSFANADHRKQVQDQVALLRGASPPDRLLNVGGDGVRTGQWLTSRNPADPSDIVARVALADTAYADRAVASAANALTAWRCTSASKRVDILRKAATALSSRRTEFIAQLLREVGKNATQADAEVVEAIDYFNYHAALLEQLAHRPRRRDVPGEDNVQVYEPCGVCVLIGPWDFPLAMLAAMVSASVAMGNTSIVKPSSKAPTVAAMLLDLLAESDLPCGVVNYLPANGADVGQHLVEHPDVHLVAFCGSSQIARQVVVSAARVRPRQRHFKRTIIDAGAQNAIIVDHDVDVDEAVLGVLESAFSCGGQKCTACSRVIVLADVYDEFCRKLANGAAKLAVGDPGDFGTSIGPVIDETTQQRLQALIAKEKDSSSVLFETDAGMIPKVGYYVAPIIFKDVTAQSTLAQEEIFGPVLVVMRADSFDCAIEMANDSAYALTGGLYSRSPANIARARDGFRVGNLYINRKITGSQVDVQPYGGGKLSGDGARLGSLDYLLQYCRPRTVSENTQRHGLSKIRDEAVAE